MRTQKIKEYIINLPKKYRQYEGAENNSLFLPKKTGIERKRYSKSSRKRTKLIKYK